MQTRKIAGMKGMILAAGYGTRLQPLTHEKPKALVEFNGKPMLEHVIKKFIGAGIEDIIINVHHFAEDIYRFLTLNDNFGIDIQLSDERDELLDTGGGILKALWFFQDDEPFVVHNVDVVSNINIADLMEYHKSTGALATLALKHRETSRYFLVNKAGNICGWHNKKTGEEIIIDKNYDDELAFSCIQVIHPALFKFTDKRGVFSITNAYLELAGAHKINGFITDNAYWFDLGTPEKIQKAEAYIIARS